MWFEFAVGSCLATRIFYRFSGFPPSTKTNISKFQFGQNKRPAGKLIKVDVTSSINIAIYLNIVILLATKTMFYVL